MKKIFFTIAVLFVLALTSFAQVYNDATLARVREQDRTNRDVAGALQKLGAAEHAYRAEVYSSNRFFPQAREHWQIILDNYATDPGVMAKTLMGVGRSYMWERRCEQAIPFFDRAITNYASTKE